LLRTKCSKMRLQCGFVDADPAVADRDGDARFVRPAGLDPDFARTVLDGDDGILGVDEQVDEHRVAAGSRRRESPAARCASAARTIRRLLRFAVS
jgi:hypothetical protein